MYLKFNPINSNNNSSKKRTVYWVFSMHVLLLAVIFFVFCFKGCTKKNPPNAIRVNIISSSSRPEKKTASSPTKKALSKKQKKTKPKKSWKALDPSQIRKSTSTVIKKAPLKKVAPIKASDIAGNIRQNIKKIKFTNNYSTNKSVLNYYDKVSQYLYGKWEQPARTVAYNGIPVVKVRVSIDSNGNILSSSIVEKSNIDSMDSSVKILLSTLSSLPKPPEGAMQFDIYLELE